MDRIEKALAKFSKQEKIAVKAAVLKIKNNSLIGLDLKKLKGKEDIFRIRKGRLRIIFKRFEDGQISILAIERRTDKTYDNF